MTSDLAAKRPINIGVAKPPWRLLAAACAALAVLAVLVLKPRWGLLLAAPATLQVHVYAAFAALLFGTGLMLWRKGRALHRIGGWIFVSLIMTVAFVSLWITEINKPYWSPIHGLSLFTLVITPLGVFFARQHRIVRHRQTMTALYFGALVITGGFTLIPGRLMWRVFFGH